MKNSTLLILIAFTILMTKMFFGYLPWKAAIARVILFAKELRTRTKQFFYDYDFWSITRITIMFLFITTYLFEFVDRFNNLGGWWSILVRLLLAVLLVIAWYLITRGSK